MTKLPRYLQELKELEAKASPKQWVKEDYRHKGGWRSAGPIWSRQDSDSYLPGHNVCRINERDLDDESLQRFEADGDLICGMRNALSRILADYEAMLKVLESIARKLPDERTRHCGHWNEDDYLSACEDRIREAREVLKKMRGGAGVMSISYEQLNEIEAEELLGGTE